MNIYRIVIAAILVAVIAALPVSKLLSDTHTKYKIELERSKHLEIKIDNIQQEVKNKATEADKLKEQNKTLQEQKSQLEKDLQAKRERQAEEVRLAAASKPQAYAAVFNGSGSCADEIRKYDWPHQAAIAVMKQESSEIPGRVNNNPKTGDYSVGCFQVNLFGSLAYNRPSEDWLKIAANNVVFSYQMYINQGRTFCKSSGWINTCIKLGML